MYKKEYFKGLKWFDVIGILNHIKLLRLGHIYILPSPSSQLVAPARVSLKHRKTPNKQM